MMKSLALAAGLLAASIGFAYAQGSGRSFITNPTGNEVVGCEIPTAGGNQACIMAQLRDAREYGKVVPTTGQTVTQAGGGGTPTYPANTSRLMVQPAGTLANLTITMPGPSVLGVSGPVDGSEFCLWSTQVVTTLVMNVPSGSGQTLNGGLTSLPQNGAGIAGSGACWIYSLPNKTWDRSE